MAEKIALYFSVFISSTVKFIAGPIIGAASTLSIFETALFTALGMMFTVVLFTFFGPQMRRLISRIRPKNRRLFSKRNRQFIRVWQRYGIPGTAFLTPLLLSPVGGAILANAFKSPPSKVLTYMAISAFSWGFILSFALKYLKDFFV